MLFAIDLHKDFIDVEGIAVSAMILIQLSGVDRSELNAPQSNRFPRDDDASFGE